MQCSSFVPSGPDISFELPAAIYHYALEIDETYYELKRTGWISDTIELAKTEKQRFFAHHLVSKDMRTYVFHGD